MGVSYVSDKIFFTYLSSWSSAISCFRSYYVGRHIIVVSLICPECNITMGFSKHYSCSFFAVSPWWIYTSIGSTFISASFSTSMRFVMMCFPGTTISRLVATLWYRLDFCSTLLYIIPNYQHNLCILIGLQHPYENFSPIHIPKSTLKTPYVCLILQLTVLAHTENITGGKKFFRIYVW